MDELEKKIENPMRPYKIHFPYQVKFHLAEDGYTTQVIINTISEEMTFARTSADALLQKEKNDVVSKDGYTNHILNWVRDRMHRQDFDECEFNYTGQAHAIEMTDEELADYQREVISVAE